MIPMVNESPEILYETIDAIRLSHYDLSRVAVTIQGEESRRECFEAALQKCMPLAKYFGYFGYTVHTLQAGEMVGK
jgi:hypothetical protein